MTFPHRPLGPDVVRRLLLDTEPWLSCDDCFEQMDQYVETLLSGTAGGPPDQAVPGGAAIASHRVGLDAAAMAAHLRGCPACAEEAATLVVLAAEEIGLDPATALARLPGTDGSPLG